MKGRGELQLGVLLENMRREGFEICVSQPRVVFDKKADGTILEPVEEVHKQLRPNTLFLSKVEVADPP